MRAWRRYVRFWGADPDADVEDELRFHLEARIAEYEQSGMTRARAEQAARERLGDLDLIANQLRTHDHRRVRLARVSDRMAELAQSLRFAARTLRRAPG